MNGYITKPCCDIHLWYLYDFKEKDAEAARVPRLIKKSALGLKEGFPILTLLTLGQDNPSFLDYPVHFRKLSKYLASTHEIPVTPLCLPTNAHQLWQSKTSPGIAKCRPPTPHFPTPRPGVRQHCFLPLSVKNHSSKGWWWGCILFWKPNICQYDSGTPWRWLEYLERGDCNTFYILFQDFCKPCPWNPKPSRRLRE